MTDTTVAVLTEDEIAAMRAKVEAARLEVYALCGGPYRDGGKAWRMCIPAQPTDSDVVICAALDAVDCALDDLEAAQQRIVELEAALREIETIDNGLVNAEHAAALMALTAREALVAPHDAEEGE